MVGMYAEFSDSRRYIQDLLNKRKTTMSALVTSYDTYDDLLSKAQKGLEFYNKLETNVTKLLQRIKSAINVQQEERDQMLKKNKIATTTANVTPTTSRTPKLKDYLDSRKDSHSTAYTNRAATENSPWPPAIRPAPLGSEITTQENPIYNNPQQYSNTINTDDITKRMAALTSKDKFNYGETPYMQQYNANQSYNTYSYPTTNANTYSTNTYQTISSVTNPTGQYGGYSSDYQSANATVPSTNTAYSQGN